MLIGNLLRSHRIRLGLLVGLAVSLVGVSHSASGTEPAKPLLPNLVADPPNNMELAAEGEGVEGVGNTGPTQLLLRFDGYVHNLGPGALDIRGSREEPKLTLATEHAVEEAERKEEPLTAKSPTELKEMEAELASPPMGVSQPLFLPTTGATEEIRKKEEENSERPGRVEEPSNAEMVYVNADGHHHWHLQKVARYSLWDASKATEVAPAQKVGFCLEDSEHVELGKGPAEPAYSDKVPPYRQFCQQFHPDATKVYEGISPGWRDLYKSELAFQWVNVSNVQPGEYWLREDVNPLNVIKEEPGPNEPAYATTRTVIPGFDALPESIGAQSGRARSVTLTSQAWRGEENGEPEEELPSPTYTIMSGPEHGSLSNVEGDQVTYTPQAGYVGTDSFTYTAANPDSQFPENPASATVSIQVGEVPQPSVSISGAPASMIAGTSVELTATVANDNGGVEWIASAGSFTDPGAGGGTDTYIAPSQVPPGGTVTVTARLKDEHNISEQRIITIQPVPTPVAAPVVTPQVPPPTKTTTKQGSGSSSSSHTVLGVSRPSVMLIGRKLIMTTYVSRAGRVRLSAYIGHHLLGTCAAKTPGKRTFTCRVTLSPHVSLHARISVWASLRVGRLLFRSLRPAAEVAQMKMGRASALGLGSGLGEEGSAAGYLCSPQAEGVS